MLLVPDKNCYVVSMNSYTATSVVAAVLVAGIAGAAGRDIVAAERQRRNLPPEAQQVQAQNQTTTLDNMSFDARSKKVVALERAERAIRDS